MHISSPIQISGKTNALCHGNASLYLLNSCKGKNVMFWFNTTSEIAHNCGIVHNVFISLAGHHYSLPPSPCVWVRSPGRARSLLPSHGTVMDRRCDILLFWHMQARPWRCVKNLSADEITAGPPTDQCMGIRSLWTLRRKYIGSAEDNACIF